MVKNIKKRNSDYFSGRYFKNQVKLLRYSVYFIAAISVIYLLLNFTYCKSSLKAYSSLGNFPVIDKDKISLGYALISPHKDKGENGAIYLVDLYGKPVHKWQTKHRPLYSILKKNGNIVTTLIAPGNDSDFPAGGRTGIIQELDWNGKILWEYKNDKLHHDIEILPNGNVAALVWERVPKEIAKKIKGGVSGAEFQGDVWADAIIEISKSGDIVWTWHAYQHLDTENDALGPLTPRAEWTHANSLRYIYGYSFDDEDEAFSYEDSYLISLREINTVAIVKKSDGSIAWRTPKSMLAYQHDATMLPNGNVLVFDNNVFRKPSPRPLQGSRVVEIDPQKNKIVWKFDGGETGAEKARFKADITSGAQRLPNGNTLIIHGPLGYLFEVTPEKELVWDFINPFGSDSTPWPNTAIFKARRYGVNEIDWPEKLNSPLPTLSVMCQSIKSYI